MKRLIVLLLLILVLGSALAGVAQGKSATVIKVDDQDIGLRFNPCENAPATVIWSNIKFIMREADDSNTRLIDMMTAKLSDSLGYSGQITWPINKTIGETETSSDNLIVTSHKLGTGKTVRVHVWSHVTIKDGMPIVNFEMTDFECVGKPAD